MAIFREDLSAIMRKATEKKSQRQIAKDAEVSQTTIGNMVLGMVPSRSICTKVAKAIGVTEYDMLIACGYEQPTDPVDRLEVQLKQSWPDLTDEDIEIIKRVVQERLNLESKSSKKTK